MKRYTVKLTGVSPLLMHQDNLKWQDKLNAWYKDPANKGKSVKGDDRTPSWTWIGYLYEEFGKIVIPADNLMSTLKNAGAMCPVGRGKKTFKQQSQSGIIVDQAAWPLHIGGKEISYAPIYELVNEPDFLKHEEVVKSMGFELFTKRARVGKAKHVRVRPRFDTWSCTGSVTITDTEITESVLKMIWDYAGAYCGLCDWRPKSPESPGMFGTFRSEIKELP